MLNLNHKAKRDLLTGMDYVRDNSLIAQRQYNYNALGRPMTRDTRYPKKATHHADTFAYIIIERSNNMICLMPITAVFCLATIFHPNAGDAYALKEDNPNVIASYRYQNMKVMKAPSIQVMEDCIMKLDFFRGRCKAKRCQYAGKVHTDAYEN